MAGAAARTACTFTRAMRRRTAHRSTSCSCSRKAPKRSMRRRPRCARASSCSAASRSCWSPRTTAWLLARGLAPLGALRRDLARIDEGRLGTRLPLEGQPTELAGPVKTLNELLARLEAAFARERQFTADVSHELRTPLAGLRTLLEVTQKAPSPADHAQALAIVVQMCALVENLLMLARVDAGQVEVRRAPVAAAHARRRVLEAARKRRGRARDRAAQHGPRRLRRHHRSREAARGGRKSAVERGRVHRDRRLGRDLGAARARCSTSPTAARRSRPSTSRRSSTGCGAPTTPARRPASTAGSASRSHGRLLRRSASPSAPRPMPTAACGSGSRRAPRS